MKNYRDITTRTLALMKELKPFIPNVMANSHTLSLASFEDGALSKKQKELIATSLAVATRCDGCIAFHAQALVKLGTTQQELAEALGVAIYMGGGPSLMTATEAMDAFLQFSNTGDV
jgi:AhpD family alkylhydroperoxidase